MEGFIKKIRLDLNAGWISPPGERDVYFRLADLSPEIQPEDEAPINRRVKFKIVDSYK